MTYYLNALQGLEVSTPVLETLNRHEEVDPSSVLARFAYAHPVLDSTAVAAPARRREISGPAFRTSYAGAYWANGFHEDGFQSGLAAAAELGSVW
jgi:predicted NAD/FAD-binding protein